VRAAAGRDLRDLGLVVNLVGPDAVRPDAGRVDHVLTQDLERLAGLGLAARDALRDAVLLDKLRHLDAVQGNGAEPLGLAEDREDQARVVGLAVVEEVGLARVKCGEGGNQLRGLGARDRAVAVGRPALRIGGRVRALTAEGHLAPSLPPRADPGGRHHVVHVEADSDQAVLPSLTQARDQERGRIDEVRRHLDHELALEQRLANQAEVEVLEVAQAAVDHLRRAARGTRRPIGALDDRDRVAARSSVQGDTGSGDAAADHDHIPLLSLECVERVFAGEHLRVFSRGR
jgi:hypothetical protein